MSGKTNGILTRDLLVERFRPLKGRAPGLRVQGAPPAGDHDLNPGMTLAEKLTPAAVLVPIVERKPGLTVLFTQRTDNLLHHAGQISFPGGHVEEGDPHPLETALRETEEEIGLDRRHVAVIGRLDSYVTRTGFDVVPIVAIVQPPFVLTPDPTEVAEVFEVPLDFLLDAANHQRHVRKTDTGERHYWAMPYENRFIWGATAGMVKCLHAFLSAR